MKKFHLMLTLALALMCIWGVTVNAEGGGYAPGVNSYTNSITEGKKTVFIYKGSADSDITRENIYYIDQSNDAEGFSNLEMLMRLDASAGEYTMVVEGGEKTTFSISDAEAFVSGAGEIEFLGAKKQNDSSYSVAYGFKASLVLSEVSALTMVMGDKAYTTDLFGNNSIIDWGSLDVYTENGKLMFAIQIDGVSADYINESGETPKFALYVK